MTTGDEKLKYIKMSAVTFDKEILKCSRPVVVEFGSKWCGGCRVMALITEDIYPVYKEKLKIVRLDIDKNDHLVKKYGIQRSPTFLFIKNGEIVDLLNGPIPRKNFIDKLFLIDST